MGDSIVGGVVVGQFLHPAFTALAFFGGEILDAKNLRHSVWSAKHKEAKTEICGSFDCLLVFVDVSAMAMCCSGLAMCCQ